MTTPPNILHHPATVLSLSGYDPTGGAGIQADIEAIHSFNCHCLPIVTSLTIQDSHNVSSIQPLDTAFIKRQTDYLLNDINIKAIKIGLLGSVATVEFAHYLIKNYQHIPIIFDPVLKAGGGYSLSNKEIISVIKKLILPFVTIITPNTEEANQLTGNNQGNLLLQAQKLMDMGVAWVLITGTHAEDKKNVYNRLYYQNHLQQSLSWPRLPLHYHGSGCTLASSIAALATGSDNWLNISLQAQAYTWHSLQHGYALGSGQSFPNRLFWAQYNAR